MRTALTGLEAALYGRDAQGWWGDELRAALKTIDAVTPRPKPAADDGLLPLYR